MILYVEPVFYEWRDCFAFFPTRTQEGEWVWLETIQKKKYSTSIPNVSPSSWVIYKRKKGWF